MTAAQKRWSARLGVALLASFGGGETARGVGIAVKAQAAQALLERAWARSRTSRKAVAPWPWADTATVARLSVPRLGIRRIVLAGASGSAMAFAPGHLRGTATPGEAGNVVIAGHRDTHFSFLRRIEEGDLILLEGLAESRAYRVEAVAVVDETDLTPIAPAREARLTLVTCFPFGALEPGGPLRYVVSAVAPGSTESGRVALLDHP